LLENGVNEFFAVNDVFLVAEKEKSLKKNFKGWLAHKLITRKLKLVVFSTNSKVKLVKKPIESGRAY